MPGALALAWSVAKDENLSSEEKYGTLLEFDEVLGLRLAGVEALRVPEEVNELAKKREKLRREEKFEEADKIREKIEKMGFEVEDTEDGPEIKLA